MDQWSFDGPSLAQQRHRFTQNAGKAECVSQGRAFDYLIRPFIVTRKFHTNREVRSALQQQLRDRQPSIAELRHRVEDRRLPSDAGFIHGRARIDLRPAIQKQRGGFKIAVLRGHVQQRRAPEDEAARARTAAVEFGEALVH